MTYAEFKQNFLPELLNVRSFAGKKKLADQYLGKPIGSGSGRSVYDIDGEKVLKLAKNPKGVAQNETEANAGYYRDTQDTVTIVFEDADDGTWLISEKAKKVSEARIKQLTGIPSLNELFYFLRNYEQQAKGKRELFPQDPDIEEFMWENEFANDLAQFVANYGQVSGDMGRPSSYGEVLRNGQPTIVLTDYGLNDEVYDTHYSGKKPARRMYELFTMGDVDGNILGNMPPEDAVDTRQDMWGFMPYSVSDGDGVINEEFLSFVQKHDKYPETVLENTPYMLDEFHNIVNNLKAVMESVEDKQKFYGNLLELQNYLIRGKFYDREPLPNEMPLTESDIVLNESVEKSVADNIANQVAQRYGYGVPKYMASGTFGAAYDIGNNMVLKVTSDRSEANENLMLIGKPLKYIAEPYKVFSIKNSGNTDLFVIILEKLRTDPAEFKAMTDRMNFAFGRIMKSSYPDVLDHFVNPDKGLVDSNIDEEKIQKYFARNPKDKEFFDKILRIGEEVRKYGIESFDYVNPTNLGYKPDGTLGFFDVGFGNYFFAPNQKPQEIEIDEDGAALYSTENSFGQDNFPVYNNTDDSPVTPNDVPANTAMYNEEFVGHVKFAQQEPAEVYKNPQSLVEFKPDVRGLCDLDDNLFVVDNPWYILHQDLAKFLNKNGFNAPPEITYANQIEYLALERFESTNNFYLGESMSMYFIKDFFKKIKEKLIRVKQKNPNLGFIVKSITYAEDDDINQDDIVINEDLEYRHASDATQDEFVINERKQSYMPGSQAVEVKKKCRLGGLGNTSVACNQGDMGNLTLTSIDEGEFDNYEKDIEQDNLTHGLDKKLIRTYDDGIDVNPVYAVNGDEVRDSGFIEWVEGGNHWVDYDLPKDQQKYAKHIPADELWVDDVHLSKPNDFEGILLHERTESYLIKHYGYTYDDAHDIANKIELLFRKRTENISGEEESERISSSMFTAFKKHFRGKKGHKEFRNEGVGDVAAEKQFGIQQPHQGFEDRFARDQQEDVVYNDPNSGMVIIRNPKRLESIFGYARGVIDPEGNLYIEQRPTGIHYEILYALNKIGLVEDEEDWDTKLPTKFVTVQRYFRSNKILLGESNFAMIPDRERPTLSRVWLTIPTYEEAKPVYQRFMDKAKQKTPIFEFINEPLQRFGKSMEKNTIFAPENNEMLQEAQIMSLQELPFKKEIEGLGGKIYSVGGAVRDEFLGKESKDLDVLITGVPFEQLEQILGKYGRVDAVGKSFGVLKFKPKGATEDIDVAIPRTEKLTHNLLDPSIGAHQAFDVKSDHALPIEKDLERRDFTINAIAKDSDGNIVDPFNGQEDLKNKIIRAVNPEAFSDDPLRMLRAIQFASRFGFSIETNTLKMIKDNASRIKGISPERILTEFDKIIKKGNIPLGVQLLISTGLYAQIFGGAQNTVNPLFSQVKTMGEFIYLLCAGVVQNPAEFYLKNLKGDLDTYKEIKALEVAFSPEDMNNPIIARSFAHNMYLLSPQSLQSQLIPAGLQKASQELLQGKYPKTVNELAVNGNDLVGIGLKGKAIGDMQKSLLVKVYADKVRNSKEELLNLARQNNVVTEEVEEKPVKKKNYGCLMLFLDVPIWEKITSVIDPDDVFNEGGYGVETEPHTTVLYGFNPEVTPDEVFDLYKSNLPVEPIKVGIFGISIFSNPEFDVVKFDVESPILSQANKIMSELPNVDLYPEYHPHITIAYVKKGTGYKYVKPFEKQRMLVGNKLVYSFGGESVATLMLDEDLQEGVADRYAQRAFNIPDPNAEQDVQAAGAVQSQEEEPVGFVKGRDRKSTPIFENPRSLANFGANVRGIIDQEGNMFIAQKDGNFNHGHMGVAMGFIESDADAMYKYLTEWMLINRIGTSNAFGLADSSYDFAEDEYDYDNLKIVTEFLRAAKRKNPQYDFYNEYYEQIHGKPIELQELAYQELGHQEKNTWTVDGQEVGIPFFVQNYDIWNQGAYSDPSDFTVIEFLHNKYPELAKDEKLKKELLWALTDRNILDEEENMERKVLYTAIVLDDKSRAKLLQRLGNMIPEGWETIAHHMTMNLGAIKPEYRKFLGMTVAMDAVDFGADNLVMAVGVVADGIPTMNAKPHITLAVNRAEGGKPMMSNKLTEWQKLSEPIVLLGKVTEVE